VSGETRRAGHAADQIVEIADPRRLFAGDEGREVPERGVSSDLFQLVRVCRERHRFRVVLAVEARKRDRDRKRKGRRAEDGLAQLRMKRGELSV